MKGRKKVKRRDEMGRFEKRNDEERRKEKERKGKL